MTMFKEYELFIISEDPIEIQVTENTNKSWGSEMEDLNVYTSMPKQLKMMSSEEEANRPVQNMAEIQVQELEVSETSVSAVEVSQNQINFEDSSDAVENSAAINNKKSGKKTPEVLTDEKFPNNKVYDYKVTPLSKRSGSSKENQYDGS